ncbi:hypothetical protein CDD83_8522 [Cordyceps sp. RAO-2017]|nr:hypothetical protein CDD83_8522 [Cordyceps sp. RAO-2017]
MVTERGFSSPGSDPGFSPNDPYEDFADAHDSGIDPNDHYQDFADADGDPGFDPNDYQDFANADDDPNFDPNDPYQVFEAADGGPAFAPPEGYRWYEATDVDEGFWGPGVYAEPATAQFESEFYRTTAYPAYAATRGGPGPGSADGLPRPTAADEERDFALAAQLQIMDLQNELSRPRPRRQTSRGSPHGIGFHEWNFPAPPRPGPFEEAAMDAARVDAARERRNREAGAA